MKDFDCLIINGDSYSAHAPNFPVYADALADHFCIPLSNLAVPGSSNDRIVRSTVQAVIKSKQQQQTPLVVIGWSFLHRMEVWYHGSKPQILSRSPDQFNDNTQLRLITLDWIPDSEIHASTKDFLTSVSTIEKKIIDWYLDIYFLAQWLDKQDLAYCFFSAADNRDFPIDDFPALRNFDFVKTVSNDPGVYQLHKFCIKEWANNNDPKSHPVTGHLSAEGHKKFANFILNEII